MRDCRKVRSKELYYIRIYYVLFLLVLAASAVTNYYTLIYQGETYDGYIMNNHVIVMNGFVIYQLILFAFETVMFLLIYRLMSKKHHYEF